MSQAGGMERDDAVMRRADSLGIVGQVVKFAGVVIGIAYLLFQLSAIEHVAPFAGPNSDALQFYALGSSVVLGGLIFILGMVLCGLADLIRVGQETAENTRALKSLARALAPEAAGSTAVTAGTSVPSGAQAEAGLKSATVIRRQVDLPDTVVPAPGQNLDDPESPVRLVAADGDDAVGGEAVEFACPWCGRMYVVESSVSSAAMRCVACKHGFMASIA